MGVFKNDVGRPSNETIKKRRILKCTIAVLVIIICLLAGYIVNDKSNNVKDKNKIEEKDNNNDVKKEEKENNKDNEIKEMSIEAASNILYSMFSDFYYFDEDVFNSDNFKTYNALKKTVSIKFNYTCKQLFGENLKPFNDLENGSNNQDWVVEGLLCFDSDFDGYYYSDVNSTYKKLYGNNYNALKGLVSYGIAENYGYSKSKELYRSLSCECGDGGVTPIYGVTKSYIESDKLYIEIVHSLIDAIGDSSLVLNDGSKIKLTSEELEDKQLYKKYQDKMDRYRFEFFKEDGIYKFEKVEKIA